MPPRPGTPATHRPSARRRCLQTWATALCCGAWVGIAAAQSMTMAPPAYALPADPLAVVLRWDSLGGLRAAGDRADPADSAVLEVHASGRYTTRGAAPGAPRRAGQLSPAQLQDLLRAVVQTHRFTAIDAADIERRLAASTVPGQARLKSADAPVTRIRLDLPANQTHHVVELHDVHGKARRHPEVAELQNLLALQQRLLTLVQAAAP